MSGSQAQDPRTTTSWVAHRLRRWRPESRGGRQLMVAALVDSTGTGLYLATSALFFTRTLGLSAFQVGIGLSLSGLGGLLGTVPVSRLADRVGRKPVLVGLYVWRGLCFAALPFVRGPADFFVLAFAIGVAEWSGGPLVQSLVGAVDEASGRVATMAAIFSIRNVGFTVGALLAAAAITTNNTTTFTVLVLLDAVTFFLAAALLLRLEAPPHRGPRRAVEHPAGAAPGRAALRAWDPRLLALTALNGVLYLHTVLLGVVLPLWIATRTSAPPATIGALVVLNTLIAVALQVPLSRGLDTATAAAHRQQWAAWALAASCLLVALTVWTGSWWAAAALIVAAAVALSLGEIWQAAGAWRLSFALAPAEQRSYYLGVYELGISASSAVGPALLTWTIVDSGGAGGWFGLAAVFVVTGLAIVLITRRTRHLLHDEPAEQAAS